jgi:hypothetical protein
MTNKNKLKYLIISKKLENLVGEWYKEIHEKKRNKRKKIEKVLGKKTTLFLIFRKEIKIIVNKNIGKEISGDR